MDRQERIERAVIELCGKWPKDDPETYHILVDVSSTKDRDGESHNAWGDGWVGHQYGWFSVCTYPEFTEARKRLENKPSWDDAPEWAEWLAQDEDGGWGWYRVKPKCGDENFGGNLYWGDYQFACNGHVFGDWSQSLERRPQPDNKEGEGVEWAPGVGAPPIGTKVEYPSGEGVVKLPPDRNGVVVVYERGEYKKVAASACERPQSHRDKVIEAADKALGSRFTPDFQEDVFGGLYDAGALIIPGEKP